MTLTLTFVRETMLARLYRNSEGVEHWIPRSVCPATFKHAPVAGQPHIHEVTIEDRWLEEHPFPAQKQKELKL
jgi:hypothetical protein